VFTSSSIKAITHRNYYSMTYRIPLKPKNLIPNYSLSPCKTFCHLLSLLRTFHINHLKSYVIIRDVFFEVRAHFVCGSNRRMKLLKQICIKLAFIYSDYFYWVLYFSYTLFLKASLCPLQALAFLNLKRIYIPVSSIRPRGVSAYTCIEISVLSLVVATDSSNELCGNSKYNVIVIFPASLLFGLYSSPAGWCVT
jgi:hypothetical protein